MWMTEKSHGSRSSFSCSLFTIQNEWVSKHEELIGADVEASLAWVQHVLFC